MSAIIDRDMSGCKHENPEATQREIAEAVGVSQQHISRVITCTPEKKQSESKRLSARQLYLPKDPIQAAAKIRAKFGAEFTQQSPSITILARSGASRLRRARVYAESVPPFNLFIVSTDSFPFRPAGFLGFAEIARIREQNPDATQREIAEVVGVSRSRVAELSTTVDKQNERKARNSENTTARQLYLPKDAVQAAAKIRAQTRSQALSGALSAHSSDHSRPFIRRRSCRSRRCLPLRRLLLMRSPPHARRKAPRRLPTMEGVLRTTAKP